MYNLSGKVAIVTGAGGIKGFGRAIAARLAREGADVVVVDKTRGQIRSEEVAGDWKGIDSVAVEIKAPGRRALAIPCDITKSKEVDKMVAQTVAQLGKVDILVNNAGIKINRGILELTDEIWDIHLAVNLTGMFYCSRAVAREMVAQGKGGRIINIGSLWSKMGSRNQQAPYTVSKFGVVGLTQSLALELAPYNILVNAVCPALTDTGINIELFKSMAEREGISVQEAGKRMHEGVAATFPLRRLGTTEDIANMVAFLASDQADFITGQSINVNGGAFTAM